MNTTTTTMLLGRPGSSPLARRSGYDWLFAALVALAAGFAFVRYAAAMDVYEKAILIGAAPAAIALGWFWGSLRTLMLGVAAAALLAVSLYNRQLDGFGTDLAQSENVFLEPVRYFVCEA